jgi:hypothetical protein
VRPDGKARIELEREANLVRSKLLRTVEELDRRGHDAFDLRLQLRNHLRQVVLGAGLLLATAVVAMAVVVQRVTEAAERRRLERGWTLRGRWRSPRPRPFLRERSFFGEVVRGVALGVLTTSAMIPVRRFAAQLARPAPTRRVD